MQVLTVQRGLDPVSLTHNDFKQQSTCTAVSLQEQALTPCRHVQPNAGIVCLCAVSPATESLSEQRE